MKLKSILTASVLLAAPIFSQSVTELLQKGIYAQETTGNFDEAILIFRQIVNSASGQREIAAQAQYRLAESLIAKGDLSTAASEFQKLASTYPDQQGLISSLASHLPKPPGTFHVFVGQPNATTPLAAQMDDLKRKLQELSQLNVSPDQVAPRQAEMQNLKARMAEIQARIAAEQGASQK